MHATTYAQPSSITDRITRRELLQLATEGEDVAGATDEVLTEALAWADGDDAITGELALKVGRIILSAFEQAESRVNTRLAVRYSVPVKDTEGRVPHAVEDAALTLAEYNLRRRRPPVAVDMIERYEQAERWLREIAAGRAVLSLIVGEKIPRGPRHGSASIDGLTFNGSL